MKRKDPAAVKLGRRGGKAKSAAKAEAARANGKKGGRPKREVCFSCGKFKDEKNDACPFGHAKGDQNA